MRFALLRVAETDALGHWALTAEFSASGVDPAALATAQDFAAAAETLARYAAAERLAPAASQATDVAGEARFSDLASGLYLVTADTAVAGGWEYRCAPFLLALPGLNAAGDGWVYDAAALPKLSRRALPNPPAPGPQPDPDPEPEPTKTPEPTPEPTETPAPSDVPQPTPEPEKPSPDGEKLPQTGQLRWPVPVLALLGIALTAAGLACRRRRDE